VRKLSETADRLRESGGEEEAGIFAHVEMAEDPELHSGVKDRVRNLESPEAADARAGGKFVYGFSEDLGATDVLALCGRKGAGLVRMRKLGFPVPEGLWSLWL
jgi:phosphoenolpyruvate-protein kinase (PTS system EI component)